MDARRFDAMARASVPGMSRRRVLRGLLAGAGGSVLVHLTGGESMAARFQRCCERRRREAKDFCVDQGGPTCNRLYDFECHRTESGRCSLEWRCATSDGTFCP
jgi:hypothetical protein